MQFLIEAKSQHTDGWVLVGPQHFSYMVSETPLNLQDYVETKNSETPNVDWRIKQYTDEEYERVLQKGWKEIRS